jgi:membrane protein
LYIAEFARYSRLYGAIGAAIVLLISFYIVGLALLPGGAVAAAMQSRYATK